MAQVMENEKIWDDRDDVTEELDARPGLDEQHSPKTNVEDCEASVGLY